MSKNRTYLAIFLLIGIFAGLSFYRANLVDAIFSETNRCVGCLNAAAVISDAWLLAGFIGLLAIPLLAGRRMISLLAAILSLFIMLAFVIDLWLTRLLSMHLRWGDLVHYAPNLEGNFSVLLPALKTASGMLLAIASLSLLLFSVRVHFVDQARRKTAFVLSGIATIMFGILFMAPKLFYVGQPQLNVFAFNAVQQGMTAAYSEQFVSGQAALEIPKLQCERIAPNRPSVILLVLESWSSYHSQLFSGLNNQTPQLDSWARRGSYFPDFIANGFSTEGGLISAMTGYVPIPTAGDRMGVSVFKDVKGDFHRRIADAGYRTYFFTSGSLDFVHRDKWLQSIGVQQSEGANHAFYVGLPRGVFQAAADPYLFKRVENWYRTERPESPFIATVLTVGTHPPFIDPVNNERSERKRFSELDKAAGQFIEQLQASGYFENGLLVVMGDHRTMVPVSQKERDRFGDLALAKVPAFVLGKSGLPKGEIRGVYQQTDLIPSLQAILLGESCRNKLQGRMLGVNPEPAKYALYSNSVQWNTLQVISAGQTFSLVLSGDRTAWSGPQPEDAEALLVQINRERIARMLARPIEPN
ncbi:MAG: LTA synthase family protein [Arenimonas sp.]